MCRKLALPALAFLLSLALAFPASARTVTDMRGKQITLPDTLTRVATIDDGFVEGVMTHLGVIDRVDMIGSWSMKRDYKYAFEAENGETWEHRGWNTMKFLHPWLNDKVCVNSPQGNVISFEALAAGNPEAVILRLGDCTVGAGNREAAARTVETIEALGLPLVVIYAPTWFRASDLSSMKEEGRIIGAMFGMEDKAAALMDRLAATERLIRERTRDIPKAEKPRVLYMGLNPDIRKQGGAGTAHGVDTPESYIIENVAGAKNAFTGTGAGVPMSAEQMYALDPDVILLPTSNGYHPPRELMEAPYFRNLRELRAVREKRVYAMPWSPMNCARRVEYPLDMLIVAKAAYPDRFRDINVYDFALNFYRDIYHVDDETARALRSHQLLDWMKDIDF